MKKEFGRRFAIVSCITIFTLLVNSLAVFGVNNTFKIDPTKAISVDGGKITGMLSKDKKVAFYKGIPFAAPPVGNLRWKAPQPVVSWDGVKKCTEYSASAIQAAQAPFMFWSKEFIIDTTKGYSEDCLYLNVWTKEETSVKNLPVIVYIHGGGNTSGGASCDVYDGEAIVKKNVVYVDINYRLGIFGFLAHPELSAESADKVSGNYAILDQIAALKWVKKNIAKFGGNPDNVTVAGQSAGSMDVHALVVSPLAKGLFKNAVAMSYNTIQQPATTLADMEKAGSTLFADKTLADMRAMSSADLLKLSFNATTCVDGKVFTGSNLETYKAGKANAVNMITGMVDGDALLFPTVSSGAPIFTATTAMSKVNYEAAIQKTFGDLSDEAIKAYPATTDDALGEYNLINRDGAMALQYYLGKARALNSNNQTYVYNFSHTMPGPEATQMGVFHTSDVPYWLNHFSAARDDYWAKIDYKLGDKMSSYLVNLAKTGNPNGANLPKWNAYSNDSISFNLLGDQVTFKTLNQDQTKFWEDYYGAMLGI